MPPIKTLGANWVAVTPYAFGSRQSPHLSFNTQRQWWGETTEGARTTIRQAHAQGLKVMLKPHVWVRGDGWCGDFYCTNEADWQSWEKNYEAYILPLAKMAEAEKVAMLCIATEYRMVVRKRPGFWPKLIQKIRAVYSGKLTYASNWDNYEQVKFWSLLDYIGVDAYFPLSETQHPKRQELIKAWKPYRQKLAEFSRTYQVPMLFTEYGYRSVDYTARRPWEEAKEGLNMQAQCEAYAALYHSFWQEKWFAGGFLWKWYHNHGRSGGPDNADFTPQNKPVSEVIQQWYDP